MSEIGEEPVGNIAHRVRDAGQNDGCPADVNLIDVLEFVADCVMASMARSGSVYPLQLTPDVLERAFQNTVELLKSQVAVGPSQLPEGGQPDPDEPCATCGHPAGWHQFKCGTYETKCKCKALASQPKEG